MDNNTKQILLDNLRSIKDFPIPGINFRDITSWFINPKCIDIITDDMVNHYKDAGITKIVGLESRGFLMGSILAKELKAGFVLARKPGKLPTETLCESYDKEYGTDTIHISADAITPDDVVMIHDDLIATGGTALAAYRLVKKFNPKRIYMSFLIEIGDEGLPGHTVFPPELPVYVMLKI